MASLEVISIHSASLSLSNAHQESHTTGACVKAVSIC